MHVLLDMPFSAFHNYRHLLCKIAPERFSVGFRCSLWLGTSDAWIGYDHLTRALFPCSLSHVPCISQDLLRVSLNISMFFLLKKSRIFTVLSFKQILPHHLWLSTAPPELPWASWLMYLQGSLSTVDPFLFAFQYSGILSGMWVICRKFGDLQIVRGVYSI